MRDSIRFATSSENCGHFQLRLCSREIPVESLRKATPLTIDETKLAPSNPNAEPSWAEGSDQPKP